MPLPSVFPSGLRRGKGGDQPPAQTTNPVNVAQVRNREARVRLADLRTSPRVKLALALCVGLLIGSLGPLVLMRNVSGRESSLAAHTSSQLKNMDKRIDQFANSCAGSGVCKTFPFQAAEQVAQLYATACFNYSDTAGAGEQAARLKSASGPDNCGMMQGTGTTTVFINSLLQETVPDAAGQPRADLGIVGVRVLMAGQPDPINYVVTVQVTPTGLQIERPGAFYSSAPNTVLTGCQPDATTVGADIQSRIQQFEAGRVNTPNIDPTDYVVPGVTIAKFGPSVTAAQISGITVCRSSDPKKVDVVSDEILSGPVPGSKFHFKYAYRLVKINADPKWYITSWGRVVDSTLGAL